MQVIKTAAAVVAAALVLVSLPLLVSDAAAVSRSVAVRDNRFAPDELKVDPGDTVVWRNEGSNDHSVTSSRKGGFDSGRMRSGDTFSQSFAKEGYYDYFCKFHGTRDGGGMAGTIIVGDPPPRVADDAGRRKARPRVVVPDDFSSIQKAVDAATPGSVVVVKPGVYHQKAIVRTRNLVIRGVDRFRTILHGRDKLQNGILVDGVTGVTVKNLTVRNYRSNGIYFHFANNYKAVRIDAIKNRTYGIYAFDSYNGVFRDSFGWGSGDSAFYVGQCMACSALVDNVVSKYNYLGYSGTNATGVVIRDSLFARNGAGVVPNTLPTEDFGPNRGTHIVNNVIRNNNYTTVPASGFSDTVGIPFGTGVWLPGVQNNVVMANSIRNHESYGVLVTPSIHSEALPINNQVIDNRIRNSDADEDGYGYDLAWDGSGESNCFSRNDIKGETSHPEMQTVFACEKRPFVGVPQPVVDAHVAASLTGSQTRAQKEPPEPRRPRCQKGRPGCPR